MLSNSRRSPTSSWSAPAFMPASARNTPPVSPATPLPGRTNFAQGLCTLVSSAFSMSTLTTPTCNTTTLAIRPSRPADLHHYVTHMFCCHFQSQPTPAPALHDGTMSWDSLQTMSFAQFRDIHSGLNIPVSEGANPLLALWQALHNSPSREEVFADLHPLLHQAPSLDKFAALINSKQGNSSGGPSGLQYKHIQHWKPAMLAASVSPPSCKTDTFQPPGNGNGWSRSRKMPPNAFRTSAPLCS